MRARTATAGVLALALVSAGSAIVWLTGGTIAFPRLAAERSGIAGTADVAPPSAVALALAASGRVEPQNEAVTLSAELIGQLKAVYVDEGDRVSHGQIVAEYVNADYAARAAEASATVSARVAALEKLLAGARPDERAQAAARLHEAETELELRQAEDARRRSLRNTGSVSPEEADRARSVRGMAEARRNAAQSALNLINAPPRREDVDMARAELALAQARLAQSQAAYDRTVIRAPVDGVVLRRFRQAGEAVGNLPPSPILRIGDVGRLRVRAEVDEADLARLALGQRVYVKADAYGQRQFGGSVVRIAPELGRKLVFAGRPTDKLDADVLDAVIELDPDVRLPIGLRVDVFFQRPQFPGGQN